MKVKVGIIGTGAFGIALASILNKNNNRVVMWSKFKDEIDELNNTRICSRLNDYSIPDSILFTNNMEEAVRDADLIVLVVPANFIDDTTILLKQYYNNNQHICIASKGIEESRGEFLHNIVGEILNTDKIGVISGPSFAVDIVESVPVGVTLASKNIDTANIIKEAFSNEYFKVSIIDDMIGVSICGCVKNIIAIGSGIVNGMGYPISTNSLLITLALDDIRNLIKGLGGNKDSILELAGIGDIILTCTSTKSRNFSFGKLIGETDDKQVIDNYVHNNTIEGLSALVNINKIVDNLDIETPFIRLMHDIILGDKTKYDLINFIVK